MRSFFLRCVCGGIGLALMAAPVAMTAVAQSGIDSVNVAGESPTQLQALVAPIALYPDPLVAQVLQASTYPDQVTDAAVVTTMHPGQSIDSQPWDASVIAVSHYPPVLQMMSKQINWTTQLGQAYLAQQGQVLQAVQALRQQAMNVGNLKTTTQQQVVNTGGVVQIYPTDPNMFYIPTYDPMLVYSQPAAWGAAPMIGYGTGWAVGTALAGTSVDWVGGSVVNYPAGTGWRDAYSNGNYHAVVGQTASGAVYGGQSETTDLARGGELTRYQGTADGWDGSESGRGAVYSNGNTEAGTFSRTVDTDGGVYHINGAAGTNGSNSGGYADITGVNRYGQTVNDSISDHDGDITTSRNDNLFSEARDDDWRSSYADRGSWSRDSFSGGGYGGFHGGGGFRR